MSIPLALGLLTLCAGWAGAETFGDLTYTPPPGWTAQPSASTLSLKPPNLAAGEVALITLSKGSDFKGDFAAAFDQLSKTGPTGYTLLSRSKAVPDKDQNGVALIAQAAVFQNASGQPLYLYYVAANPPGRLEILVYTASSLSTFQKYEPAVTALAGSVTFGTPKASGTATAPPPTKPPPTKTPPQTTPPGTQPAVSLPVPNLAKLVAGGFDPEKQPIPDEFSCYPDLSSDKYQTPVFKLQILNQTQYRVVTGKTASAGTFTTKKGSVFYDVQFKTGPLASVDSATLFWGRDREYGQNIKLYRYPLKDDRTLSLECYQRGPRDALAQLGFRRKDPQIGKYACRSSDGKNTDQGTLEVLAERAYRYKGSGGKYSADILGDQSNDFSSVDFTGGPLDDTHASYSEDDLGEREFSFRAMKCLVVVKPTLPLKYGAGKAPAPPKGTGGLTGAYSLQRQQVQVGGGIQMVRDFYMFSKNGYVFTGDPDTSLADADCTRIFPNGLPICEVYRLGSGQITIGSDKPVPFQQKGGVLRLDGEKLEPVRPLKDLKLAGDYKSTSVFSAPGGTGGGIFETVLKFGKDGRFRREASGGVSITTTTTGTSLGDVTGGVSSSSERQNGGKYTLSGNTLTLSYDDGRVEKKFAMLPQLTKSGQPDTEWLYLGDDDYFLQKPGKK
ncbi:hypothetical protein [Deinococcus alpinitundrae]|uniref:hypothetical protein n=1 Tax=Deinococcus alpinitundrae TaxID=468913 RepID=UPI00137B3998|nr:hypothetical protein [Deinococcus alpinitundrae]